jgi:hypothetical protein
MREIPSKIFCGGLVYSVVLSSKEVTLHTSGGPDVDGICCHDDSTIYIRDHFALSYMRYTLLHECMHAVAFSAGINDAHKPELGEEDAVRAFTPGVLAMLRQNPLLVAFLTGDDDDATQEGVRRQEGGAVS